ncbi:MAG: DUF2723 domain-containing protein [Chloroflexota bacterium]
MIEAVSRGAAARGKTAVFPTLLTHPGLLAGSAALLVYLLTLAPDLTWRSHGGDGGELIAASVTLGVPHPTGYPTYVLLGKLFSLLPIGTVAYRFNLFSAVAMAAAVGLTAVTLHTRFSRTTSLAASLTLAFAPLVWSQATITEVYGLNLLAVAAVVWAVVNKRPLFQTTLLYALALTTHATSLLLLPLVAWAVWETFTAEGAKDAKEEKDKRVEVQSYRQTGCHTRESGHPYATQLDSRLRGNDISTVLKRTLRSLHPLRFKFLLGFLLGLAPLLALPWLARPASPIVWGRPDTLQGWGWLVSGQLYRANLFALPWPDLAQRLADWSGLLARQFGWLGVPLIAWGCLKMGRGQTRTNADKSAKSLIFLLLLTAVLTLLHPLTYATPDAHVLLLPTLLLLTFPLAAGMEEISRKGAKTQRKPTSFASLRLCVPFFSLVAYLIQPPTDPVALRPAVAEIFAHAPANAVLLTPGDATIFTLWYFHHAEQQRPDVVLVDSNLFAFEWYRQRLAAQYPQLRQLTHDDLAAFQQANQPFCTVTLNPTALDCTNRTRTSADERGRKTEDGGRSEQVGRRSFVVGRSSSVSPKQP